MTFFWRGEQGLKQQMKDALAMPRQSTLLITQMLGITIIIFIISATGRQIEALIRTHFSKSDVVQLLLFLSPITLLLFWRLNRSFAEQIAHFWWKFFICILLVMLCVGNVGIPAETVHIYLFSTLGFVSGLVGKFGMFFWAGLAVGLCDEVFQYFLPNRFFDWRDVFMNWLSFASVFLLIQFKVANK